MVLITRTRPSSPVKGESPYFPTKSAPASLRNVSPDPGPTEIPDHNGFSGPVELPGGSKPSILEEPEDSERPSGPVQSPDYEETIGEDQGEEEGNEGQGEQEQHGEEERLITKRFSPSNSSDTPVDVFHANANAGGCFTNINNNSELFIYIEGKHLDLKEPGTGCAFRFGMPRSNKDWSKRLSFKLETLGPTGESHPLTTQRARLRAIIAALQYDKWATKGFTGLVIVTSSKNLVDGIIIRLPVWKRRGWRGQSITIPDRDLWECLMEEISKCKEQGLEVKFWLVPKDHNMNAYWLAHKAVYQNSMLYDGFTKYTAPPWCF